jgi:aspartate--ammonia ligase
MSTKIIPQVYKPIFEKLEAQKAIKLIKDTFERILAAKLNLTRVSAPLMVPSDTGVNDLLNGYERPVEFDVKETKRKLQIVQSLAKWKRIALKRYGFNPGEGLYTDMNAIRRDEDTDNIHSIYVDQWDWEKIITKEQRTEEYLRKTVREIFEVFKQTEDALIEAFPEKKLKRTVPNDISFISSQELEDLYPDKRPKEREHLITKEKGAVFITQIGKKLKSGKSHDGRSPDYDDWELNGDILLWFEPLGISIELSSMGIRVDEKSLEKQLKEAGAEERKSLLYHRMLLNGELPLTIGGGLGQSRICMYFMKTVHIGEVQSSVWPEEMIQEFREKGIEFL